jgi:hypothetical protein
MLKWLALTIRILPMLNDVYEQVIAIIAVVNTERKDWNRYVDPEEKSAMKRLDAVEFVRTFKIYSGTERTKLDKIINSAWNFVFQKEL